jgi:methionyl-tRNA formyltransferase
MSDRVRGASTPAPPVGSPKLLVLCTVQAGLDAVAEVLRRGNVIAGIVGVHPEVADPVTLSGYVDVAEFALKAGVPFHHVRSYGLNGDADRRLFESLSFDVVWVAGWQRLVPGWLIAMPRHGVLGTHGSPDGILGGRGRSPQTWALLLGCSRFDLALFRITPGVDDGPVIAERSFFYKEEDDIAVSYYRAALATADMVCEALAEPDRIVAALPQREGAHYYPQRLPEDGQADWALPQRWIAKHCRALTAPYPGLRTSCGDNLISIWQCQPFDDVIDGASGMVSTCFGSGDFLVNCRDGRVLVRRWSSHPTGWTPQPGLRLSSMPFHEQLKAIIERHDAKMPGHPISERIKRWCP